MCCKALNAGEVYALEKKCIYLSAAADSRPRDSALDSSPERSMKLKVMPLLSSKLRRPACSSLDSSRNCCTLHHPWHECKFQSLRAMVPQDSSALRPTQNGVLYCIAALPGQEQWSRLSFLPCLKRGAFDLRDLRDLWETQRECYFETECLYTTPCVVKWEVCKVTDTMSHTCLALRLTSVPSPGDCDFFWVPDFWVPDLLG